MCLVCNFTVYIFLKMKLLKHAVIIFVTLSALSCTNRNSSKDVIKINAAQDGLEIAKIQNVEVEIKGMTCEIGCAKLIESKTHKLDGMTFSNVSFEHGLGQFTFDSNKISLADIEKHINGIAGGELYKVTSSALVNEFTVLEKPENVTE